MNPKKSFTLYPSSAFSAYVYNDDASTKENNKHNVIAGTIRQDFERPRPIVNPEAGLGIRASPFEPLVHNRNLPKSGTISPLNTDEYSAWRQSRQDKSQRNNPLASEQCHRVDDNDENSWKLRYLKSEIARTETRMSLLAFMEEKRQMRIKILGLQAELYLERSKNNAEKKQSMIKLSDGVAKNHSIDCDISSENEIFKHINVTRGSCASNALDSSTESLPDASELDFWANEGLASCVNTNASTLDNENPNLVVKKAESSTGANALVVLDNVQTNPSESHKEPAPSVRMTRSRGRQNDTELKVKDESPEKSENLAEETVARVSIDDHDHVNFTSDNSTEESSKTGPAETVSLPSPDYSFDGMSGMNRSATGKGKRKLKDNLEQTRRPKR